MGLTREQFCSLPNNPTEPNRTPSDRISNPVEIGKEYTVIYHSVGRQNIATLLQKPEYIWLL
jgi:hypothetical protein